MGAVLTERTVVGERLKRLRGSRTQSEVAEAVGVTPMCISQYESGDRTPVDDMKVKLANYFDVPLVDIFFT